jgi:dipeptidyl aminopeptidase/acylaminoacyl peptidase
MIGSLAAGQVKRAFTPADVVDVRTISEIQVSPDGSRVAFVVTEAGDPTKPQKPRDTNIWVVPADGSQPARLFAGSPKSDTHPRWSPDGRWLAFLSSRGESAGDENAAKNQIYLLPTSGGEAEPLTSVKGGVADFRWSRDGKMIAFTSRDPETETEQERRKEGFDEHFVGHDYKPARLWVVTMADHKAELVTRQDLSIFEFDWSPDGLELVAQVYAPPRPCDTGSGVRLAVIRRLNGEVVRTLSDKPADDPLWSPDGRSIVFEEPTPTGITSWMAVVPASGGEARPLLKDYAGTPRAYEWESDSRHLVVEATWHTHDKFLRVDTSDGSFVELPAETALAAPGFSSSANGLVLAYARGTRDSPVDVWAYTAGGTARKLTELNPQVKDWRFGAVKEISWKSKKDGLTIYGVLVTPPDFNPDQRYPTLVMYHGGPAGLWWSGFVSTPNVWAQLAASRGYVVFMPNPRGSLGQGWKFVEANRNDWGGGDFRDAMDGVDYLIDQKIADPARLGVGGMSYGGYLTAWTVTQTNRFKAAFVGYGMTDNFSWAGTSSLATFVPSFMRGYFLDTPYNQRANYDHHSAMTFLKNCQTPSLLLYGEKDDIVPVGQGWEFYNGLHALGKPVEFVVYPREPHGFHERAHQIDSLERIMAWYDKYLKP